jgi:hypothetical protein
MTFIWIAEQTTIIYLYSVDWFLQPTKSVFSARYELDILNVIQVNFCLQSVNAVENEFGLHSVDNRAIGYHQRISVFWWLDSLQRARASSVPTLRNHRLTALGRTPLDELSAHRRDFYLTTHNRDNREKSMRPVQSRMSNVRRSHVKTVSLRICRLPCIEFMTQRYVLYWFSCSVLCDMFISYTRRTQF